MTEAGGGQVQCRLPVRECADHARSPADLAQDAFQRIVRPDAPPVLLGEGVIAQRFLDAELHELCGACQPLIAQLGNHLPSRVARATPPGRVLNVASTTATSIGMGEAAVLSAQPIRRRDCRDLKHPERAYNSEPPNPKIQSVRSTGCEFFTDDRAVNPTCWLRRLPFAFARPLARQLRHQLS